jgi:hypothetical protein
MATPTLAKAVAKVEQREREDLVVVSTSKQMNDRDRLS